MFLPREKIQSLFNIKNMRNTTFSKCIFLLLFVFLYQPSFGQLSSKIQNTWWKLDRAKAWNCFLPGGKAKVTFPDKSAADQNETWKDLGNNKISFKGSEYEIISVDAKKLVMKTSGMNLTFISMGKYETAKKTITSPNTTTAYKVGDKVQVLWEEKWYAAEILEVIDGKYKIHYDGWEAKWDEVVDVSRMKK
jgi:hypothetical protein